MSTTWPPFIARMVVALALPISSAAAQTPSLWLMIAGEGEKPNRELHLAQFDSVRNRTSIEDEMAAFTAQRAGKPMTSPRVMGVRVVTIHESAKQPDAVELDVEYRCETREMRVTRADAWHRDFEVKRTQNLAWRRIEGNLAVDQGFVIACEQEKIRQALQLGTRKDSFNAEALNRLGMSAVPKTINRIPRDLADFAWLLWPDGQRPPYIGRQVTPEEQAAFNRRAEDIIRQSEQALGSVAQRAQAQLDGLALDEVLADVIAQRRKAWPAGDEKLYAVFAHLLGRSEPDLVRILGAPASSHQAGSQRFIRFVRVFDNRSVLRSMQSGQVVQQLGGRKTCEATFELQRGGADGAFRAIDLRLKDGGDLIAEGNCWRDFF